MSLEDPVTTGPYRKTNLTVSSPSSVSFPTDYATITLKPRTPLKHQFWSRVLGPPFRSRQYGEEWFEYHLKWSAHIWLHRRKSIVSIVLLALVVCIGYVQWRISTGTTGIDIGKPPPSVYGNETVQARKAIVNCDLLPVFALERSLSSNATLEFKRPSRSVNVEHLTLGLHTQDSRDVRDVQRLATTLLDTNTFDRMPCICAPLLGVFIRVIGIRDGNDTRLLLNPVCQPNESELRAVRHTQSAHFNIPDNYPRFIDNTSDVMNVRQFAVELVVEETHRSKTKATFEGPLSYCVQECLDLMKGCTIWERAQLDEDNRNVNEPWLKKLRVYVPSE